MTDTSFDRFTPTTQQVEAVYAYDPDTEYRDSITNHAEAKNRREFRRWLVAHEEQVRAEAFKEAAQIVNNTARQGGGLQTAEETLRREADAALAAHAEGESR